MCTVIVSATLLFFLSTSGHVDFFFSQNALVLSTKHRLFAFLTFTHVRSCQCIPFKKKKHHPVASVHSEPLELAIHSPSDRYCSLRTLSSQELLLFWMILAHCILNFGVADSLSSVWRLFGNDDRKDTMSCTYLISITLVDMFQGFCCCVTFFKATHGLSPA